MLATRLVEETSRPARTWPLLVLVGALLACGASSADKLRDRASFDLDCPKSKLQLKKLDSRTAGVRGCGQRATYVEVCDGASCTWVLNSDSMPD